MSDNTKSADPRCQSTRLSGARCTLTPGHLGAHMQIEDNGVTGWENDDQPDRLPL